MISKKEHLIKKLSRQMLESHLNNLQLDGSRKYKFVVWGCGESGKTFISHNSDMEFSYIVDSREKLINTYHEGYLIYSPDKLFKEPVKSDVIVFLPTVIHSALNLDLREAGFEKIIVPNQHNVSGVGLSLARNRLLDFVDWLLHNDISYCYQKAAPPSLDNLLDMKDFDILVDSKDLGRLIECPYFFEVIESEVISVDIMWSEPIGVSQELPFFPNSLARDILDKSNILIKNNLKIVKDELLLVMYSYHIVLHKGNEEALEKYKSIYKIISTRLGLEIEYSLDGILLFLNSSDYPIALDFARKWLDKNNSSFLKSRFELKSNKHEKPIFILRDFFRDKPIYQAKVLEIIRSQGYNIIELIELDERQLLSVTRNVRGGVWIDSNFSNVGGLPYMAIYCKGLGIDARETKVMIRKEVSRMYGSEVNCIHASDDDLESQEFNRHIKF